MAPNIGGSNIVVQNKEKRLALGVYPETGLKDARAMRAAARKLLAEGTDPGIQRKENKQRVKTASANTFRAMAYDTGRLRSI